MTQKHDHQTGAYTCLIKDRRENLTSEAPSINEPRDILMRILMYFLCSLVTLCLFSFAPFAQAQLHSPEYDIWKVDCKIWDEWNTKKHCGVMVNSRIEQQPYLPDERAWGLFKNQVKYAPKSIVLAIRRTSDPSYEFSIFREKLSAHSRALNRGEPVPNPYTTPEEDEGLFLSVDSQGVLASQISPGQQVFDMLGVRVDQGDPVYSDLCAGAVCRFDASRTALLLEQFKNGKSISIRLYDYDEFKSNLPFDQRVGAPIVQHQVSLTGFAHALEKAFGPVINSTMPIESRIEQREPTASEMRNEIQMLRELLQSR